MATNKKISDEELDLDVRAYYEHGGSKSEAARARGLKRRTYTDRLTMACRRFGIVLGKAADGRIKPTAKDVRRLPSKGQVSHYLLTSIQNNTYLHPGWHSLTALRDWLDGLEGGSCEILVGTYSYQTNTYGPKAVKRGKHSVSAGEKLWYARECEEYIVDHSVQLAPGLVWCGEQNILPTTVNPLRQMEDYNGRASNVVPHAKIAMESVASLADEATKLNYSTGTVTQMNYIQKRAGILAEQRHSYGGLLASVDSSGNWYVQQLHIGDENEVYLVGPSGFGALRVTEDGVEQGDYVDSISWADAHAAEMELWVRELAWGPGGMLDALRPERQFFHDVFSMRSRGHHEDGDFHRTFEKHVHGEDDVEGEVQVTAEFLAEADREWCQSIVVPSNHDRHFLRWLNEADFRKDPLNARFFCLAQHALLCRMEAGDRDFNVLEWALKRPGAGCPEDVLFLGEDESYVICKEFGGGIECGLHGDLGPDGARGSTRSLTKLGRAVNKGHDHRAGIFREVYSGGVCTMDLPYTRGPSSHSVTHIVTFENGARTLVTMWAGKWRA